MTNFAVSGKSTVKELHLVCDTYPATGTQSLSIQHKDNLTNLSKSFFPKKLLVMMMYGMHVCILEKSNLGAGQESLLVDPLQQTEAGSQKNPSETRQGNGRHQVQCA